MPRLQVAGLLDRSGVRVQLVSQLLNLGLKCPDIGAGRASGVVDRSTQPPPGPPDDPSEIAHG
jgi:hypothetical protein